MISKLVLKNFRKHEDLTLEFGTGLVVIRGANEAGKTTVGESILYALFGASTMREPLAQVVTYDKAEASLKVELSFTLDGVDYVMSRGKSGAELKYSDQMVTGQKETRLFIERLLGCTSTVAGLLMFADQDSIRGVLSAGDAAANSLVEKLASLGIIEELVDKVQSNLPSGNTKSIDQQIENFAAATVTVPDLPPESDIATATAEISALQQKIDLTEQRPPSDQEASNAVARVQASRAVQVDLARLEAKKTELSTITGKAVTLPGFTLSALQQARQDAANLPEQRRRWAAAHIQPETCTVGEWEGTVESAKSFRVETETQLNNLKAKATDLRRRIDHAKIKRINDKSCAFCQKDLTDVPEVLTLNAAADAEVLTLEGEMRTISASMVEAGNSLRMITTILHATEVRTRQAGEYWQMDSKVPPNLSWIGEPATEPGQIDLPAMEKKWTAYQQALVRRDVAVQELEELVLPVVPDTTDDEALIAQFEHRMDELATFRAQLSEAKAALLKAETVKELALARREAAIQQNETNAKLKAKMVETRDAMLKHNLLVKKLRAARPEIASKMWGTVLGAISRYFSQIRGEVSVVSRDADGFKVNGRGVDGLSGSTKDALGLAIRMALCKLFLPSVPFLFLDESFSACDADREMNGISTISGAGFDQVLFVTHSDAAEALCSTLITL